MYFKTQNNLKLLLAVLAFTMAVSAKSQTETSQLGPALDNFILQQMEQAGISGLAAAIIVDKQVVWSQGYGFADKAVATPFTVNTIMNIGSISKTFTGVAMMQAVAQGKLALDQDINTYLPFIVVNPFAPTQAITLRQLATHSSAIRDRWSVYRETYHYGGDATVPLDSFLRSYFTPGQPLYAKENFLAVPAGSQHEYSNIGAALAGYIVERAVGEPLHTYTKQHIFKPLGMQDSGWLLSEIDQTKHSKLYIAQDGLTTPIPLYGGVTYPDGGVRTSVADLAKFFISLLNAGEYQGTRILDQASAQEMLRFQFNATNKPENLQLEQANSGLFWATKLKLSRIGHGGSDPGIKTEMLANQSKTLGVILFVNTSLSGQERRHHTAIFKQIWQYGETIQQRRLTKPNQS